MNTICLVPVGRVDETILQSIGMSLWQTFGFECQTLRGLPEPGYAFDVQRKQYSSSVIIRELLRVQEKNMVRVLGITECDLFIPMLSFVFGHAQLNGQAAIVSLARLRQEFYRLPPNNNLLTARAMKEAVHEVGHTFGLVHCADPVCAMSVSNAVHLVDTKTPDLCKNCSIILEQNTKHLFPLTGVENT